MNPHLLIHFILQKNYTIMCGVLQVLFRKQYFYVLMEIYMSQESPTLCD